MLRELARWIAATPANDLAVDWLRNVPGLPPIAQTVHLLSIAIVMGSIVLINLRALGLAASGQHLPEMVSRLMPWLWTALPLLLVSGLLFVLARPNRYLTNPVFGLKFAMLVPAILLTAVFQYGMMREGVTRGASFWDQSVERRRLSRCMAAASLLLWVGVVFAGRWIAYVDYLFPPE